MFHIVIDDRERALFPYLDQPSKVTQIPYEIRRINVGDYAICNGQQIKMIIERKTWEDLAASFRDGRKANVVKLISARQETGCILSYLIEGPACPRAGALFGRIPLNNLRAHLDHLALRDNIHIIYSSDVAYSGNRLFELAKNMRSLTSLPQINQPTIEPVIQPAIQPTIEPAIQPTIEPVIVQNLSVLQTTRHSAINIQIQMLQCLPSVGSINGPLLYALGITIKQIMTLSLEDFVAKYASATYPDGRSLKKVIAKVHNKISLNTACRIIECIPGMTRANAAAMLNMIDFADLFIDFDLELLANVKGVTKIGAVRAKKIYDVCYGEKPYL